MEAIGSEQLTAANLLASIGLQAIPADAQYAWVQADNGDVRMALDGTVAVTTRGMTLVDTNPPLELSGDLLSQARFIREGAGARLNVIYFGPNI